ncbi:outer membrane beta-barrel protein [Persicobacter psychrovividus]|uniref:Outer membrane protein beta-barrel domain-containing protein n=1 Tax=Persicobacter psychrovividus TaxID=387638 RepID=A0ABN6LBN1_9BACT|nr:hypothetical protein PEPS_26610 [Persicobacter psychrovividus]
MKKFTSLIVVLLCLLGFQAQAQVHLIPSAGLTVSSVNKDAETAKAGYRLGLNVRIGEELYVQPGFFYTKNSAELDKDAFSNNAGDIKYDHEGFEIPVMIGYHIINSDAFKFRGHLGPQFGFGYTGSISQGFDGIDTNSTQWTLKAGLGIDVLFFTLDAEYGWGLSDSFTITEAGNSTSYKSRSFNLTLGIRL